MNNRLSDKQAKLDTYGRLQSQIVNVSTQLSQILRDVQTLEPSNRQLETLVQSALDKVNQSNLNCSASMRMIR